MVNKVNFRYQVDRGHFDGVTLDWIEDIPAQAEPAHKHTELDPVQPLPVNLAHLVHREDEVHDPRPLRKPQQRIKFLMAEDAVEAVKNLFEELFLPLLVGEEGDPGARLPIDELEHFLVEDELFGSLEWPVQKYEFHVCAHALHERFHLPLQKLGIGAIAVQAGHP